MSGYSPARVWCWFYLFNINRFIYCLAKTLQLKKPDSYRAGHRVRRLWLWSARWLTLRYDNKPPTINRGGGLPAAKRFHLKIPCRKSSKNGNTHFPSIRQNEYPPVSILQQRDPLPNCSLLTAEWSRFSMNHGSWMGYGFFLDKNCTNRLNIPT